jgi:hypothetical protein
LFSDVSSFSAEAIIGTDDNMPPAFASFSGQARWDKTFFE